MLELLYPSTLSLALSVVALPGYLFQQITYGCHQASGGVRILPAPCISTKSLASQRSLSNLWPVRFSILPWYFLSSLPLRVAFCEDGWSWYGEMLLMWSCSISEHGSSAIVSMHDVQTVHAMQPNWSWSLMPCSIVSKSACAMCIANQLVPFIYARYILKCI